MVGAVSSAKKIKIIPIWSAIQKHPDGLVCDTQAPHFSAGVTGRFIPPQCHHHSHVHRNLMLNAVNFCSWLFRRTTMIRMHRFSYSHMAVAAADQRSRI